MKKILYITTVSRTINAFLVPHIQMLLQEGYRVDIATCIDKPIEASLLEKGVIVHNIPFGRNPLSLGNLKAFKQLLIIQKQEKYDFIRRLLLYLVACLNSVTQNYRPFIRLMVITF